MERNLALLAAAMLLSATALILFGIEPVPDSAEPESPPHPDFGAIVQDARAIRDAPMPVDAVLREDAPADQSIGVGRIVFPDHPNFSRRLPLVADGLAGAPSSTPLEYASDGSFRWPIQVDWFQIRLPLEASVLQAGPAPAQARTESRFQTEQAVIDVPPGQSSLILEVRPADCLEVLVKSAESGELIHDLELVAYANPGSRSAQLPVDSEGRRWLPRALLDGTDRLQFWADYSHNPSVNAYLDGANPEALRRDGGPLEFTIPHGGSMEFTATSSNGEVLRELGVRYGNFALEGPTQDGTWLVRRPTTNADVSDFLVAPGHVDLPVDERWFRSENPDVVLRRSIDLEIAVIEPEASGGWHARVVFPDTMRARNGPSGYSRYVRTPGFPRAPERAVFRFGEDRQQAWHLEIPPRGETVIEQLPEPGRVEVTLLRLGAEVETRTVDLPEQGGIVRVEFRPDISEPVIPLLVVDERGDPIPRVEFILRPRRDGLNPRFYYGTNGRPEQLEPVSCWTDRRGAVQVPASTDPSDVVWVRKQGYADLVRSYAELRELGGRLQLPAGRAVILNLLGADLQALEGPWSSGGGNYSAPYVHLGHGVWRTASSRTHPGIGADQLQRTEWLFADLPPGEVVFRIGDMGDFEFRHRTAIRRAECIAPRSADDIPYGK